MPFQVEILAQFIGSLYGRVLILTLGDTSAPLSDLSNLVPYIIINVLVALEELFGRLTLWHRGKFKKIINFCRNSRVGNVVYMYSLSSEINADTGNTKEVHMQNIYLNTEMLVEFVGENNT